MTAPGVNRSREEGEEMALEIKLLNLIDIELDSSFLVLARNMGIRTKVPTFGFLILGGEEPILVDTGASSAEIMHRLGMSGWITEDQELETQLGTYGLSTKEIRWILHTHLHIDHAGQDDRFPSTTTVVINRRELEHSVSGLMGEQYPAEYIKHLIDRLHTPGALRLLDLELSGPEEIIPGVRCEVAGGHTEGSMNVLVETAEGTACICGDVIYDIQNQIVEPIYQCLEFEPQTTGNHSTLKRQEKAAIKKALQNTFVLPVHDYPGKVHAGRIVARLKDSVPGPEEPVEMKLPSETGAVVGVPAAEPVAV
jgi:glyoxylase-like metal-dependent hydrolase (beta-lactamase superfamily II)